MTDFEFFLMQVAHWQWLDAVFEGVDGWGVLEWEVGLEARGPGHEAESRLGFAPDSGQWRQANDIPSDGPGINQLLPIFLLKGAIRLDLPGFGWIVPDFRRVGGPGLQVGSTHPAGPALAGQAPSPGVGSLPRRASVLDGGPTIRDRRSGTRRHVVESQSAVMPAHSTIAPLSKKIS